MKTLGLSASLLAYLMCANVSFADVIVTTPYPYDNLPPAGVERGTYAFNGSDRP